MPADIDPRLTGLAAALGIGLLIGIERERRKGKGPARAAAGLRTFTLASLLGALAVLLGNGTTLAVLAGVVGVLAIVSYRRSRDDDPGLTTEIALVLTFMLGALAMHDARLATGIGVLVAIALAARSQLHRFVVRVLSEQEVHDGLLLAAAALVILPLVPDRAVDPLGAINPRTLWKLAVLMMAINACGHIALRAAGPALGLSFAGFASGFVSSTATIAAMGAEARRNPALRAGAVSGAVLSSLATVVYLALLLAATSPAVLRAMAAPLLAAGVAAAAYGLLIALRSVRTHDGDTPPPGRPFNPRLALLFAATMGALLLLTAFLTDRYGTGGAGIAAALAGFADAHSASAAVAALQASGRIAAEQAVLPILAAFTTNACSKLIVAVTTGDRGFALQVVPGVLLSVGAAWLTVLI